MVLLFWHIFCDGYLARVAITSMMRHYWFPSVVEAGCETKWIPVLSEARQLVLEANDLVF